MVLSMVAAFAADPAPATSDLSADKTISIQNVEIGDTVNLYKVIEWDATNGKWAFTSDFADLGDSTKDNYSANVKKLVDNDKTFEALTKEDVEKITNLAKAASPASSEPATDTTYTKGSDEAPVAAGMYLALVEPVKANMLYNPIVVSSDYTAGGSNTIDAAVAKLGSSAVAKKDTVTLTKEASDITLKTGEIVKFTVTTTIPAYAKSYVNPAFNMKDSLSTGLEFVVDTDHPFTVTAGDVTHTGDPKTGDTSFELTFTSAKIAELVAPQSVTVEYYAKLTNKAPYTVNEETNDVTVEFSNNPKDDTKHGHLKDEVKEYTFTIDGSLFGESGWTTSELVKVGLDKDGNPIEKVINQDNGHECAALDGAVFGLYTTEADANADTNRYTNDTFTGTVTTANGGLMEIKGLKAGKYYLKEISAPTGYIKDTAVHTIEITYTTKNVEVKDETLEDGCKVSYDVTVLDTYTVSIDGKTNSTYTMTLQGPVIEKSSKGDKSTDIVNTKGVELPSTGGMGTTILYVGGSILVILAAVLLITKRRMNAED